MSATPRLFAVMCTFRRPDDAAASLMALARQDIDVELVIVVDNAGGEATRNAIESSSLATRYLAPGSNLGPAGGVALALSELDADDNDLVLLLDDDDPLPDQSDLVSRLIGHLEAESADQPATVGIGLRGGNLDSRTGLIAPSPGAEHRIMPADHIHGGAYPIYRIGPLRRTNAFNPDLFWGFEELAAGRTLRAAGFKLIVAGDLLDSASDQLPKLAPSARQSGLPAKSWRHYFRHRNLLRVLRRERAWRAIATVVVTRLIGKPIICAWRSPRLALWHFRVNVSAIIDGIGPESRMKRGLNRMPP